MNLKESKISYQMCKQNLARQGTLLDFLDEDHPALYKARLTGALQQRGGQPRSPRAAAAGDLFRLISGPGALKDITEATGTQQSQHIKLLTQGLQMTRRLNMISSDSEGETT